MNNRWLWLSKSFSSQPEKAIKLFKHFGDIDNIWNANAQDYLQVQGISLQDTKKLLQNKSESVIKEVERILMKKQISWIAIDEETYPLALKHIYDPPCVLFYRGILPVSDRLSLGIVGTRRASNYAREATLRIGRELAEAGVQIISGMARGVDTFAHEGALSATSDERGKTFAVLGCGLDLCYPAENHRLMKQLMEHGGVISEYLPGTPPMKHTFPLRNRIISGLSQGIIISEAARKSGSLITSDYALEHGRDIFVIPGRIYDPACEGSNQLLKQGAKAILQAADILEEYQINEQRQLDFFALQDPLGENEKKIYEYMSFDPISLDTLVTVSGQPLRELLCILFALESKGLIKQIYGRGYYRTLMT